MNLTILTGLGIISGLLSGYLGVGAAIIVIPVLTQALGFDQKMAQSISLSIMIPMALAGALMYRYRFGIAPPILPLGLLAAGAVAGSIAGSVLANLSPARHLKLAFALFVILTGAAMLVKAILEKEKA